MGNKIAVVICVKEYDHMLEELKKAYIPNGYEIDVMVYPTEEYRIKNINNAVRESNAKYKIFFNVSVETIDNRIFYNIIDYFNMEQSVGVLGVLGSEIPIDGDYRKSEKIYGAYYKRDGEKIQVVSGENPLFYQQVSMVDFNFFATSSDILFDESLEEFFLMPAYCSKLKKNGLKTIVVMQNENAPWIIFREKSIYEKVRDDWRYEIQLRGFYVKYVKAFLPLVSILIPAYNNTYFLKQSLESAIGQDYPNVEILVGDDSTNDDVKEFIKPYLLKYEKIQFYHHGGPLGGRGGENVKFLLKKSKGEYVKLLFHDDILVADSISEMMKYYISDMKGEIGLVASVREAIDEHGKVLGTVSPWIPDNDVIIAAKDLPRKILYSGLNFIGEYSTVLIRKKLLWVSELNGYYTGYYKGFIDVHMGDVSSWLNIAEKRYNFVFLKDRLSYFRMHSNQNTYNNNIQIGARLDWYALCLLAYDCKEDIHSAEECFFIIKRMDEKFKPVLSRINTEIDDEFRYMYKLYNDIHDNVLSNNMEETFKIIKKYIKLNCPR